MVKPTFIGIGAMKAGTSSVHEYLRKHPEVFVPKHKEQNWFRDENKSQKQYEDIFPDFKARGEISPSYDVFIPKIAKLYPGIKLIYNVRNTTKRFISAVGMLRKKHPKNNYDADIMMKENSYFLQQGLYQRTIQTAWAHKCPIWVINFDNIVQNQQKVFNGLCRFLGVSEFTTPYIHSFSSKHCGFDKPFMTKKQEEELNKYYAQSNKFMKENYGFVMKL
jgi:hypothetical protein